MKVLKLPRLAVFIIKLSYIKNCVEIKTINKSSIILMFNGARKQFNECWYGSKITLRMFLVKCK